MATDHELDGCTVTSFFGGVHRGPCVQITGRDELDSSQHVVLTRTQAIELAAWIYSLYDAEVKAEADVGVQDQTRKRLLARVAGNVATGVVSSGLPLSPSGVAELSVRIAAGILHVIDEEF